MTVIISAGAVPAVAYRCFNARHCERSEAIQNFSANADWIASLRSQ